MRYRAFVPYSILGTGLWASAHILIGYFFSRSIETAAEYAGRGAFLLGDPDRRRRRHGLPLPPLPGRGEPPRGGALDGGARRRPAGSSSSARRFRPQLQFLWDRVTPGGTFGLEFTSLMATLAVARFVLVAYTVDRQRRPRADARRHDRDRSRRKPAAPAGSPTSPRPSPSSAPPPSSGRWPSSARSLLAARRRWAELGVLLAGMAIDLRRRRTRSRTRSTGRARTAAWSTPRAPPSPAATPPTRPSTSGWR